MAARQSWLDETGANPLIDHYVQQLGHFIDTMADGRVDDAELLAQEHRLSNALRDVESDLNDEQHAKVTKLLCELTAYNVMQTLGSLQSAQVRSKFQG